MSTYAFTSDVFLLGEDWDEILEDLQGIESIDLLFHNTGKSSRVTYDPSTSYTIDWAMQDLKKTWAAAVGYVFGMHIPFRVLIFYDRLGNPSLSIFENPQTNPETLERLFLLHEKCVCELISRGKQAGHLLPPSCINQKSPIQHAIQPSTPPNKGQRMRQGQDALLFQVFDEDR